MAYNFYNKKANTGKLQKKLLVILIGGVALGLSGSPIRYYKTLFAIRDALKEIDNQPKDMSIMRSLQALETRGYVNRRGTGKDATYKLTKKGKNVAQQAAVNNLTLPKEKSWNGKWHIVMSDIPESHKKIRDALRYNLRKVGFKEIQKSVWVYPYACKKEVDFLLECYRANEFIQYLVVDSISNDKNLKKYFVI